MGRKTRIGPQMYLFSGTASGQLQLDIFLSQDGDNYYNDPMENGAIVYSQTLFTSPQYPITNVNNAPLGNVGNGAATMITLDLFMLFKIEGILVAGTTIITIGTATFPATATFTDNGIGGFAVTGTGVISGSSINYVTGIVVLMFSVAPNALPSVITTQYYYGNIQTPTAASQAQIWQRMNTSLIGDTVQIGFTLSDEQMRDTNFNSQFAEIEFHGAVLDCSPSSLLT
jgi:hypothetical protein